MPRMRLHIAHYVVEVVLVKALVSVEVAALMSLLEALVVLLEELLVLVVGVGGHGGHLVLRLHKLFMNNVLVLLPGALVLIRDKLIQFVLLSVYYLLLPGIVRAKVGELVSRRYGKLQGQEHVGEVLFVSRGVVHQVLSDAEFFGVYACDGQACHSEEGADLPRQSA